jgi:hypothetical protein
VPDRVVAEELSRSAREHGRPRLTPDQRGGSYGAWRLASVNRALERLQASDAGHSAFNLLRSERLPFSYAEGEPPRWFQVIQALPDGNLGIRFYLPSIRRGCIA